MWDEVERLVEGAHARFPGEALELLASLFGTLAEALESLLGAAPVPLIALVVAVLAWRRAGPVAAVGVAVGVGLLGLSRLWSLTLETLAIGLTATVIALVVLGLLLPVRRVTSSRVAPSTVAALAGPLLMAAVAVAAVSKPLAGSGSDLAWIAAVGLAGGLVAAPSVLSWTTVGPVRVLAAAAVSAVSMSVVHGLVGVFGLGGALVRAIQGGDIAGAADAAFSTLVVAGVLASVATERWVTTKPVSRAPSVNMDERSATEVKEGA